MASELSNFDAEQFFTALIGEAPETVQKNRKVGPANPFLNLVSGHCPFGQAVIQVQPDRVDLIVSSDVSNGITVGPPECFDFRDFLSTYVTNRTWEETSVSGAYRIAIGATLLKEANSYPEAIDVISDLTGISIPFRDVWDFGFQLNRRKQIIENTEINRLIKYSVALFSGFVVNQQFISGQNNSRVSEISSNTNVMVELDVNTVPSAFVLTHEFQGEILKALAMEAETLASDPKIERLG
ncbi:hypothetical protein [uncultured Pleomorphomonas sp.]|uniref:hypothetical protein n=1 Tax=uncultured Pleomorphomonas sp. TaxID=442121 RepID=UPI00258FACB6|nr:hypothetical protein [uncultured Pleomorphomonas sp.]